LESVEEKFKQTERSMGKAKVLVEMLNHERDTTWVPLEAKQVQLVNEIRLLKQSLSASETSLERANQEQKSLEEELLEKEKALAVLRGELECLQTTLARRETEWRTATEKVEQLERLTGQQQQKVAQLEKELARNAHVNKKMREQKAMLEASVLETNRRAEELYRNLEAAQETLSSKEGQLQEEVHLRLQLQKIKGELKAQHERSVAEADNFRALIGYFAPQILDNSCTEYTLQQVLHVSVDLKNSLNKKTAQQKSAIKYLNNYAFEFLHGLEVQQTLQKTIEEKVQKIAGIEKLVAEQFDKILEERKGTAVELDFIREENKKLMQVNQHFINLTKKLEHEKAALESQMIANMTDITRQNEKLTTFAVTSKNTRDAEVQQLQSEREFLAREVLSLKKQLNEEREKNTAIQTEIEVANSAVLRLSQPSRTPAVGPCDSCGAFTRQIEDLNHQNSVLRVDCDDLKARYEHVISAYECVKDENETLYAEQRDLLDKYHRLSEDLRELLHYHHKQRETHNFAFQTLKNKYESLDPDDYELQKVRVRELTSELDTVLLSRKEALDKYNSCQSELQKAIQRIDELQAVIRQYHQIDSLLDSSDLNSTEIYLNKLIDLDQSEQLSLSRDDARMSAVTNIIEELKDARPMREAVALLWTLYKSSDSVLPDSLDSTAFPYTLIFSQY
jgi:chromosome segregation ATPase